MRRALLGVAGLVYAALLTALLLTLWLFGDAINGNGAVNWGRFFREWNAAFGYVGLSLGEVEVTEGMRALRLPSALFIYHVPIVIMVGIVFVSVAGWLWNKTLGRLIP